MKCNDPAVFAFVMPTKDRPDHVGRALGFLAAQGFVGHVLCVDASSEAGFARTGSEIAKYPSMTITHDRPRALGNAWREIVEALGTIDSTYVQLHHDDDFYFLDEIERAIGILETDAGIATAQGRFIYIEGDEAGDEFSLSNHDRFQYLAASPSERMVACMDRFAHLSFAVTRRSDFASILAHVHPSLEQGWFDQYAISILLAARGRAVVSDALYGVRQRHDLQHHKNFLGPNAYKHWPMILASPDFSAVYLAFKNCLIDGADLDDSGLAEKVDIGLAALVTRAAGILPEREAEDIALFERANRPGTAEHDKLKRVVAAIRRSGK